MADDLPDEIDWTEYYKVVAARPPRDLFRQTIPRFPEADNTARLAVDLGCGAGNETIAFLDLGWRVLAIDQQAEALDHVRASTKPAQRSRLESRVASLKDVALPPADFIWASASLPFVAPEDFAIVWDRIVTALKPDGRFAGDFFGPRHAWATRRDMNFHDADQVRALCRDLLVEYFIEEEGEKITATRGPQHWHAYSIVARKT